MLVHLQQSAPVVQRTVRRCGRQEGGAMERTQPDGSLDGSAEQKMLARADVRTTTIYTGVLIQGATGARSPLDTS